MINKKPIPFVRGNPAARSIWLLQLAEIVHLKHLAADGRRAEAPAKTPGEFLRSHGLGRAHVLAHERLKNGLLAFATSGQGPVTLATANGPPQ